MNNLSTIVLLGLLWLGLIASGSIGEEGIDFRNDIFIRHQDGYHTYRIPTMVVTAKGTVLLFCEGRKRSRKDGGDVDHTETSFLKEFGGSPVRIGAGPVHGIQTNNGRLIAGKDAQEANESDKQ